MDIIRRIVGMGTKKQDEKSRKLWIKILAVGICVVFAAMMIISAMGSSWISSLAVVQPGDVAVVDYTIRDTQGKPLVTTDAQVYKQAISSGSNIFYSKQLTVTANQSSTVPVYPVSVYSENSGWSTQFAMFDNEYDAISNGIVGMRVNSQKTLSLTENKPLEQVWSVDQLEAHNLNISALHVGTILALGVSQNPEAQYSNSTSDYYIRLGEVTNKTADDITIDFSYPTIDVTVTSLNKASS
jgi:hypothetical protein